MDRTTLLNSMKNVAMKVTLEEMDKYYKHYSPIYPKLVTLKPMSEIEGAYYQTTSVIGSTELIERAENVPITFEDPVEGYPIYIKKRSFDLGVEFSLEFDKDYEQIKNFIEKYVRDANLPHAVLRTKEKMVANMFNYGGYTAGHSSFNNSVPGIVTPSYGSLVYDGKPLFEPTTRSSKGGGTYANSLGALSLTYDNMLTGDTLLCSTNAKLENDEPFDNSQGNVLAVPSALKRTAKKLLESEYNPTNANNDVNTMKGEYGVVVNPYFTDTNAWFLGNKKGIWMFDSNEVTYDFWEVHETRQIRASASIRLAIGVVNWRSWVAANVSTS